MYPILFELSLAAGSTIEIKSYRAAYLLAIFVALLVAWLIAKTDGLPQKQAFKVLFLTALSLPLGARLWHILTNWGIYIEEPWRIWTFQAVGHALFGGILLASLVGLVAARAFRLNPWLLADGAAPGLGLGIVIMRLGCLANGCCFGRPTRFFLGITFPPGSYAHLWQIAHDYVRLFDAPLPVHPTQVYEAAGALLGIFLWLLTRKLKLPVGVPFLSFIAFFAVVRSLNWFFRVPPETLKLPSWIYYPIYASTIVVSFWLIALRFKKSQEHLQNSL